MFDNNSIFITIFHKKFSRRKICKIKYTHITWLEKQVKGMFYEIKKVYLFLFNIFTLFNNIFQPPLQHTSTTFHTVIEVHVFFLLSKS